MTHKQPNYKKRTLILSVIWIGLGVVWTTVNFILFRRPDTLTITHLLWILSLAISIGFLIPIRHASKKSGLRPIAIISLIYLIVCAVMLPIAIAVLLFM